MSNTNQNELQHYGVLGMKWGIRRYQNPDGSLTEAGKRHLEKTGEYGYHYKSWGRKHEEKLVDKYKAKAKEAKTDEDRKKYKDKAKEHGYRAERARTLDAREEAYARRVNAAAILGMHNASSAYTLGMRLATGVASYNPALQAVSAVGSKSYQMTLAMLNGADESGVTRKKALAWAVSTVGSRPLSTVMKAMYMRNDDFAQMMDPTAKRLRKKKS